MNQLPTAARADEPAPWRGHARPRDLASLRALARRALRPTGRLPRPTRRNWAFDAVLALVLGTVGYLAAHAVQGGFVLVDGVFRPAHPVAANHWIGPPLVALLTAAPLVLRRRYPLAVLWAVMAATLLGLHDAPRGALYAGIVAAYSAAAYSPYRAPTLASLPVAAFLVSLFQDSASYSVPDKYVPFLILIPVVVAADAIRIWQRRTDEGRDRLAALEHEQVAALRQAVGYERARLARELHDVVTHNVSMMVIQAGAARRIMDADPDDAREALLAVESAGRAAMSELRQVMGLLTMDTPGGDPADPELAGLADLAPQPGLDRLEPLLAGVRATGVPIELAVLGTPVPLPPGIELAGYRVVQEALTNMVKHAVGASATVTVEYGADRLRVEVADTGGSPGASAGSGNRRGLVGLRERLALYGGTLQSGPRPTGGFRVRALIPLEAP